MLPPHNEIKQKKHRNKLKNIINKLQIKKIMIFSNLQFSTIFFSNDCL
jgi:hypothetical protein